MDDSYHYTKEEEEKTLRDVGVTDLIETMRCKNCLYLQERDGKHYCKDTGKEVGIEDDHCPTFTENLNKQLELKGLYDTTIEVLKEYIDTSDDNYKILALWIMGTWLHDNFLSYPYLFINAMKGSGKTRLLKLIKELSWKGDMLASLTEAVLFRTDGTLAIDEFEGLHGKDKNALRELLNTAYKKGGKVKRMWKKKTAEGEKQEVEEFNTFRPIVMANIWGMEEVLGDRCITIILEKSDDPHITKKIEDFNNYTKLKCLYNAFTSLNKQIGVVKCSNNTQNNIYIDWNKYINNIYNNITTLTTLTTPNYTTSSVNQQETEHKASGVKCSFFDKIYATEINGRHLELAFPLFMLAEDIGILNEIIPIFKRLIEERKEEDVYEGRDVMLLGFVSEQTPNEWYKTQDLTNHFRQHIEYDPNEEHWLNSKWMGRALKRLKLLINKRRLGQGVEIMLDIKKAAEKMRMFR